MKVKYKIFIITFLLGIAIVSFGIHWGIYNVLPYSAIKPSRTVAQHLINTNKTKYSPKQFHNAPLRFSFFSNDSIIVRGWFIPTQFNPKGTIIVLHGIASSKELMLPYTTDLLNDSFNVVLYDSRAHGESGGDYCTLGFYEKYDVSRCIDKVIENYGNSCAPFGLIGNSMGAAITLQTLPLDNRIVCGVAESSFANLRETLSDYLERMIHVRWNWIANPAFARSEEIAHFSIDEVVPERSARAITQPVLLIHGDADNKINIKYAYRILENLHSTKELYIVHNGGHENLSQIGGEEYHNHIRQFFAKWMKL
jgi:pimeloyl-ACP methyl ester carboxylesterase